MQQSRDLFEALEQLLASAEPLLLKAQARIGKDEEEHGDLPPPRVTTPSKEAASRSLSPPCADPLAPPPVSMAILRRLCPWDQSRLPALLQQQSTALAERTATMAGFMAELQDRVVGLERGFGQAAAAFSQECHALETLQDPPAQHVISIIKGAAISTRQHQ